MSYPPDPSARRPFVWRKLTGGAVVVVLLGAAWLYHLQGGRPGSSTGAGEPGMAVHVPQGTQTGPVADVGGKGPRLAPREEPVALRDRLIKILSLRDRIQKTLEADEQTRAKLIQEKEDEKNHSYTFEISRRPDFEDYYQKLVTEVAAQGGANAAAVRQSSADDVRRFNIPEGYSQKVDIVIPKDPHQEIEYFMSTSADTDDPLNVGRSIAPSSSGTVPLEGEKGFSYRNLIDIGDRAGARSAPR